MWAIIKTIYVQVIVSKQVLNPFIYLQQILLFIIAECYTRLIGNNYFLKVIFIE